MNVLLSNDDWEYEFKNNRSNPITGLVILAVKKNVLMTIECNLYKNVLCFIFFMLTRCGSKLF